MALVPTLESVCACHILQKQIFLYLRGVDLSNLIEAIRRPELQSIYSPHIIIGIDAIVINIAKFMGSGFTKILFLQGIERTDLMQTVVYDPIDISKFVWTKRRSIIRIENNTNSRNRRIHEYEDDLLLIEN